MKKVFLIFTVLWLPAAVFASGLESVFEQALKGKVKTVKYRQVSVSGNDSEYHSTLLRIIHFDTDGRRMFEEVFAAKRADTVYYVYDTLGRVIATTKNGIRTEFHYKGRSEQLIKVVLHFNHANDTIIHLPKAPATATAIYSYTGNIADCTGKRIKQYIGSNGRTQSTDETCYFPDGLVSETTYSIFDNGNVLFEFKNEQFSYEAYDKERNWIRCRFTAQPFMQTNLLKREIEYYP